MEAETWHLPEYRCLAPSIQPLPVCTGYMPRLASSSNDFCTGTDPHR
jgi:hypothetical protein